MVETMSFPRLLYISSLLLGLAASQVYAAPRSEIVQGGGPSPEATMDYTQLFNGPIPKISDGEKIYANKGGTKACRKVFGALRRATVQRRPAASSAVIVAKALRAGIKAEHIKRTLATYLANRDAIPNQRFISVIDFNKASKEKRLYTIDLSDGTVRKFHVTGGAGSDPNRDGKMTHFSNRDNTHASSVGCALAAGEYYGGKRGTRKSLMLHGFEKTNDNMCNRSVVVHGADYAGGTPGASWGCPAVKPEDLGEFIDSIGGGGLICSYKDGELKEAPVVKKKLKRRSSRARRR